MKFIFALNQRSPPTPASFDSHPKTSWAWDEVETVGLVPQKPTRWPVFIGGVLVTGVLGAGVALQSDSAVQRVQPSADSLPEQVEGAWHAIGYMRWGYLVRLFQALAIQTNGISWRKSGKARTVSGAYFCTNKAL